MKQCYLFCAFLLCLGTMDAQIIYSEDFENGMPDDYVLANLDGLTPDDPDLINMADSAWTVKSISAQGFGNGNGSKAAFSVSWYVNDEGPSNDWMILPAVTLGADPYLQWTGMAITSSGDFRDQYQVFVVTGGQTVEDYLLASPLFDTGQEGEQTEETPHSLFLGDFAGETVYIAFRNTTQPYDPNGPDGPGNGGNELVIDNIVVSEGPVSTNDISSRTNSFSLYPSVNNGAFTLEFLNRSGSQTFRIIDMQGKVVYSANISENAALYSQEYALDLNIGHYQAVLVDENGNIATQRIVVAQ